MDNFSLFKCKNCGDMLDARKAVNGVIECPYCHTPWTVPRKETSHEALKYLHDGNAALDVCKFEEALTYFQKASEFDSKEPEAYFGMALSSFKIQYLQDSVNNRLQPICHEVTKRKITENKNYQQAIFLATPTQRVEYERRAAEIDYICEQFYRFSQTDLHYDSFICVKVTDNETGNHTTDSKDADYIYRLLKERGYSPFYSEYEIRNKTGSDYEAHILYALYSSECMLIVCTNEEYLQTKWVKNEYTRFLQLVNDEKKEDDSVTIVFSGAPIERLPGRRGKIQGIDFGLRESDNKIIEFVESHTPLARKKREEMLKKQQEEEEKRQKEEEMIHQQIELLTQKLQNVQSSGGGTMATVQSLLTRAEQELMADNFENAEKFYDRVLEADPFNGYAWWGMLLIQYHAKDENIILENATWQTLDKIENDRNYINANQYADETLKTRIQRFMAGLRSPERWWNEFLAGMGVSEESEILGSITAEKIERVTSDPNYNLAKKYASGDFLERITAFENKLYSPETNWRLFLDEWNVSEEGELLPQLTPRMLQNIESSVLYRNATREATGAFRERLDSFTLQLHSGELWWDKFLKNKNVSSYDEIIDGVTAETISEIEEDPLYQNAVKYATGDCGRTVREFNAKLYSGEKWWNKFLADFHVTAEDELLAALSPEIVENVHKNLNYQCASKYATGETKEKIEQLEAQFVSSERWWNLFLASYGIAEDEEFFADPDRIEPDILERVSANECFKRAEEYADEEMTARIARFTDRLKSSKFWWDLFLHRLGVKEAGEFFEALPPDGVERVGSDRYYANAMKYAKTEEEEGVEEETAIAEIRQFDARLRSYSLWWETFLKKYGVEEAGELLVRYTAEVDGNVLDDPYFLNAQKFADNQQKADLETLKGDLTAHHAGRQEALRTWASLLRKMNVRKEADLNGLLVPIKREPAYLSAVKLAGQYGCVDLVQHYEEVASSQFFYAKRNKHKKHVNAAMSKLKSFLSVLGGMILFLLSSSSMLVMSFGSLLPVEWVEWLPTAMWWPEEMAIPSMICSCGMCLSGLIYLLCCFRAPKRMWVGGLTHLVLFGFFYFTQTVCECFYYDSFYYENGEVSAYVINCLMALAVMFLYMRMGIRPTYIHYNIWLVLPLTFLETMILVFHAQGIYLDYSLVLLLGGIVLISMLSMLPHALYGNISRCVFFLALLGGAFWHISGLAGLAEGLGVGEVVIDISTFFVAMYETMSWLWALIYLAVLIALTIVVTKLVHKFGKRRRIRR